MEEHIANTGAELSHSLPRVSLTSEDPMKHNRFADLSPLNTQNVFLAPVVKISQPNPLNCPAPASTPADLECTGP